MVAWQARSDAGMIKCSHDGPAGTITCRNDHLASMIRCGNDHLAGMIICRHDQMLAQPNAGMFRYMHDQLQRMKD